MLEEVAECEEVADVRASAIGRCLRRWQMFEEVADVRAPAISLGTAQGPLLNLLNINQHTHTFAHTHTRTKAHMQVNDLGGTLIIGRAEAVTFLEPPPQTHRLTSTHVPAHFLQNPNNLLGGLVHKRKATACIAGLFVRNKSTHVPAHFPQNLDDLLGGLVHKRKAYACIAGLFVRNKSTHVPAHFPSQ
jgi:hypothetical protein